ncbi:MAG: hypothetical protein ACRDHP_05440 [Ktedonobacterales bacterium]
MRESGSDLTPPHAAKEVVMRLSLPRPPRQRTLDSTPANELGTVYGCVEEGCGKLALQSCVRCGLHFCTQHIRAWERDLPARGLKPIAPDWYCIQCRSYL